MTKTWFRTCALALLGLACAPALAHAQIPDSVFAVTRSGESLLRVNVDGKVGIGTSTPDRRLTVNGSLGADSVVATAGFKFPDGSVQTTAAGASSGTSVNTPSTLVARNASGAFAAGWVTVRGLTVSDNEANGADRYRLRVQSGSNLGDRVLIDSAGGLVAMGSLGIGIILKEGAGERMLWHPYRSAFRAGSVSSTGSDLWNDSNIGFYSIAGGLNAAAQDIYGVSFGGWTNSDGDAAIAMGFRATADANYAIAIGRAVSADGHEGAILIGDGSTSDSLMATAINQFSLRAAGGIRLFTNSTATTGMTMNANGSAWNTVSDRNRKENFLGVDGEDLLARLRGVPVTTWNYIAEGRQVRHMGPMAQDWHAAFGFNGDPLTINQGDFDGVNLAGVKALDARTQAQQARIDALQGQVTTLGAENAVLKADNARLSETSAAQARELAELRARMERIEAALSAQGGTRSP